jgi:tRNA threonylcarbamoyladenosine biosynthesis protein TsaB
VNILAIDTATTVLSVALGISTGESWYLEANAGLRHSELVVPLTETLLKIASIRPEELGMVACMQGPGSFTGIRIGFSVAKGIATGLGIPLTAVPTLDCMAYTGQIWSSVVIPVIDAKRHRYFAAVYRDRHRISNYLDVDARYLAGYIQPDDTVLLTGPAADMVFAEWNNPPHTHLNPYRHRGNAQALLEYIRQGDGIIADTIFPVYIRKSDTEKA